MFKDKSKKILITGGHPAPAIAVIDYILKNESNIEIIFVGKKFNNSFEKSLSFEFQEISNRNILFEKIETGRSGHFMSLNGLLQFYLFIIAIYQAYKILKNHKPNAILTFGGYIGLPVIFLAKLFNIPIVIHEQTAIAGTANRLMAFFAKKVCISFPESRKYFVNKNIVITGNPIRDNIFDTNDCRIDLPSDNSFPVIYVTGGSLGSHAINNLIEPILPEVLEFANVIHQTGNVLEFADFDRLQTLKNSLPDELKKRYYLFKHIATENIGCVYNKSDLIISRSGANTFFEILALKKPSIFIPLPYSAHGEQLKHAKIMADAGTAHICLQSDSPKTLLKLIHDSLKTLKFQQEAFKNLRVEYIKNASEKIINEFFSVLN
jgi:UDP-N-acetylglucosamine--N-acetylmuramyl-(pentapeptide) pyrophosphoryl-undecaprenol N-acetylglucosamine transferase